MRLYYIGKIENKTKKKNKKTHRENALQLNKLDTSKQQVYKTFDHRNELIGRNNADFGSHATATTTQTGQ